MIRLDLFLGEMWSRLISMWSCGGCQLGSKDETGFKYTILIGFTARRLLKTTDELSETMKGRFLGKARDESLVSSFINDGTPQKQDRACKVRRKSKDDQKRQ
mmetsp:Transcript_41425/g.70932  ORF Transcript_41425/g.70932 Transcript_41425/m.70932 type:complete len:102 (+) Transcript_41425:1096-1401(+)